MIALVHLPQVLPVYMSVDLRRGDVGVTKHLLYRPQVRPTLQEVRRERVPEGMRRHGLRDAGPLHVLAEDLPRAHSAERLAARVEKERSLPGSALELRPLLAHVDRERADRAAADRHEPL